MSTRESLELECDTPECTYTLGYFSNHSSLQHKSTKDGWYRDAWTDRCPECVAKMSEPIIRSPSGQMPSFSAVAAQVFETMDRMSFCGSGTQRAATTKNDIPEKQEDDR